MKIAVLTREFSPKAGGAEHYAMALVEGLAARHEVHVFAQRIEHHWPRVHYHLIRQPFKRPRFINQWWYALETWRQTRSGFDIVHAHENTWHGEVQTVHVLPVWIHYFAPKPGAAAWLTGVFGARTSATLLLALKWLNVLLSPRLLSYLWLESARLSLTGRHAQRHITSVSSTLTEQLLERFPLDARRVHTLMPGVWGAAGWWQQAQSELELQPHQPQLQPPRAQDGVAQPPVAHLDWRQVLWPGGHDGPAGPAGPQDRDPFSAPALMSGELKARARLALGLTGLVEGAGLEQRQEQHQDQGPSLTHWLLWVGHDDKKKGLHALLKALARVSAGVGLMVVGRGASSASARALSASLGLDARVAWLGPMSDVAPAYWACDALVHPTLEDTFGMVVLEAMSWARAVVVSAPAFCGVASELTHGQEAWVLADPQDVVALARALEAVLEPRTASALGARAWAWAQERNWASVCLAQEAVYREVLQNTPSAKDRSHG